MVDILGNGTFGADHGIKCECGGKTYLVDDQGDGLKAYQCEDCDETFQVQYENSFDDDCFDDDYYMPPYDPEEMA